VEIDFFALFLALGEARLAEARAALALDGGGATPDHERAAAALVPMAIDAALLGAEGLSTLADALVRHGARAERAVLDAAFSRLAEAVAALGHADASGARADEASLIEAAKALAAGLEAGPAPPGQGAAAHAAPTRAQGAASGDTHDAQGSQGSIADEVNWVPSLPEELIGPFLDECQERIEGLSQRILSVEEHGPQAGGGEEIRALFRDLHTLKGSSGFAGLARLNRLAHAAEDLVAKVRDGQTPCTRPVVDVLLASLDRFRAIVDRASARAPIDVEVDDLVARLRSGGAELPRAEAPKSLAPPAHGEAAKPAAPAAPAAGANTLRVEFERVDQLQNFVNELVLARSRLSLATEGQLNVGRELARVRRQVWEMSQAARAKGTKHDDAWAKFGAIAEELGRTERVVDEGAEELDSSIGALSMALGQLRDRVMKLRMIPIARLFSKHQRTVRELAAQLGKKIKLELVGENTELDKVLVEALEDPLIHLVRNAVDHGVETPEKRTAAGKPEVGTLTLRARQQGGAIVIEIADDGGGIDAKRIRDKAVEKGVITPEEAAALSERESLELIFRAGFSTAEKVTDVSGRGVGMDVVRDSIARLKGTIEIRSELGRGSTFELRLPLTLAVATVLLARVGGEEVAIPIDAVAHTLALGSEGMGLDGAGALDELGGRAVFVERTTPGEPPLHVPVVDLAATLGLDDAREVVAGEARAVGGSGRHGGHLVILDQPRTDVARVALSCDALLGRHEVVVKPLGALLSTAPCVAGASLLGDRVVLLLDVAEVVRRGLEEVGSPRVEPRLHPAAAPAKRARILIAEDADVVREGLRIALERSGFEVAAARDGVEALELAKVREFDLVSTDVMMPRLDGYELTRALRKLPAFAKTPIVMVTSRDKRVDVLRGYDAGVDAYVTKPADVTALLRTIEELLSRAPK
jgi:chemotaxis protein histidine kinase CheA/CheY-like chemotaxis protein